MELGAVEDVAADEAMLFLGSRVGVFVAGVGRCSGVIIVAPFRLLLISSSLAHINIGVLTKWFANSKPGVFADAYSKSMTINCLCSFAGVNNGDSPDG